MGNLLRSCNRPQDLESAQAHISHHQKIVETLPIRIRSEEAQVRRFRPLSPVKVLSNFLGSPIKDSFVASKEFIGDPFSKEMSAMLPPNRLPVRSSSLVSALRSRSGTSPQRGAKAGKGEEEEEVRSKLRECQEEVRRLKRENIRLERECAGLRSQLNQG